MKVINRFTLDPFDNLNIMVANGITKQQYSLKPWCSLFMRPQKKACSSFRDTARSCLSALSHNSQTERERRVSNHWSVQMLSD